MLKDYYKMSGTSSQLQNDAQVDINSDLDNKYDRNRNLVLISKNELQNMRQSEF